MKPAPPIESGEFTLMRGDVLHKGRYRLIEEVVLPKNQQGIAWSATDTRSARNRVLLYRMAFPDKTEAEAWQAIKAIVLRLTQLSQYPCFPTVVEVFNEYKSYYIVLLYPTGESLASLMQRQGGAIPERDVAEYGRQVCQMLEVFASQRPPVIHGAISPETVIVNPSTHQVSLIYIPLFPLKPLTKDSISSGYTAPEQVRGDIKPSSDLYSLAATLHHAVTGFDPRERLIHFYPPARRLNPVVTLGMEAALSKGLRLSVPQRYATPSDMLQDLRNLIASYPPVSELPQLNRPFPPEGKPSPRGRRRNIIFTVVGICAALALLFTILLPILNNANQAAQRKSTQQTAWRDEMALEQQTFTKQGIGISDGRFVFDTYPGRSDVALKQQAAQALQHNDLANAINFFSQAVSADPTDGEVQIYNENLHVLQSNSPYVTIVLGIAFDESADDLLRARPDTQGAFIAQYEINKNGLLGHGLKLRILLDSCGAHRADVATVAQFVANRVSKAGNPDHIVSVEGWPFSSQTINALDIITSAHLPIVSPASSVKLSGSSPYFFRIDPPDDIEGNLLAKTAAQQLHAKTILVSRDSTDPYSVSLADAFSASATKLGIQVINSPGDYFKESTSTVTDFQKVITDAQTHEANLIFIAGYSIDGIRLAHALGNAIRIAPNNTVLANLNILGGDGVDTNLVIGQGNGPDAQIATEFPQDMRHLIFTAYCAPDEWDLQGIPKKEQPAFFSDWNNFYSSSGVANNNAPPPGNDSMLATDAIQVIARAISLIHGEVTGQATRDALASLGKGTTPAFQGVSGRILFDNRGNPIDKAMVVLQVASSNNRNAIQLQHVIGTFR
ncbi:ABC transporter substrate-binding protein [Ktedonobacter sp. SOSP1-85]|uniref:ABC transporter substrate-binding protein n=1 Tax=Ktedonobacter sp. SOSP1-85 TaxID=2778367 RepID=UPI0019166B6E|nr:ABC transporter substrate-binding protein [Ktedonobacter sp. SOSP1-85]